MAYSSAALKPRDVAVADAQLGLAADNWRYVNSGDSLATIRAANYFDDAALKRLRVGNRIYATGSDGSALFEVTGVSSSGATVAQVSGPGSISDLEGPAYFEITHEASETTDGIEVTFTAKTADGQTYAGVVVFDWWISESAAGAGLTGDTYSGDVTTPSVGTELEERVSKKLFTGQTSAAGVLTALAVDSANPADQYFCARNPNGTISVSAVSGTNWEGVGG